MKKLLAFISLGSMVTFGLFAFMAFLISSDNVALPQEEPPVIVEIIQLQEDSKPIANKPALTPPPVVPPPKETTIIEAEPITTNTEYVYEHTDPDIIIGTDDSLILSALPDGEARPIVRVNPKYPSIAAQKGIEGWVLLAFDINAIGEVVNVKVIESEPKRIFDKAAKQALKKWKYRAKSANGNAVSQTNLTVQLDFTMSQST